jgi:putative ABC transport system permease protein
MLSLRSILKGVISQKTRSILTICASICATCMLTGLGAFYQTSTETMHAEIDALNNNNTLTIALKSYRKGTSKLKQSEFLQHLLPHFEQTQISSSKRSYIPIQLPKTKHAEYFEHIICDWRFARTHQLTLQSGRFFHELEHPDNNFVILGHSVAEKMQAVDAQANSIFIDGKKHHVLGVLALEEDPYYLGKNSINQAILTHFNPYHQDNAALDEIIIQVDPQNTEAVTEKIKTLMQTSLPNVAYEINDFSRIAKTLQSHINKIKLVLIIIGSISSIIAMINIINGMYAVINERLEEIAIRLSIGATHHQVQSLFLLETMILSMVGSLVGIIIGEIFNQQLVSHLEWTYTWRYQPGLWSALLINGINILACYIPLRKISSINPIKIMQGLQS